MIRTILVRKNGKKLGKYNNGYWVKFWVFSGKKVGKYKNFLGKNFSYPIFFLIISCPRRIPLTLLLIDRVCPKICQISIYKTWSDV